MKSLNAKIFMVALAAGALGTTAPAHATIKLLGSTSLSPNIDDLRNGADGTLESGASGDLLGGFGSGMAFAGGHSFYAVPDRGPNAKPYNSAVDDTTSYKDRFQTLQIDVDPTAGGNFNVSAKLTNTTLLTNASGGNYIGLSSDFANRMDPEGIRMSNDGKSVFVSDEYGPYVRQFDSSTGALVRQFTLPDYYNVPNQSSQGAAEISGNTVGRVANKGMEGLAITPDGKTLVGMMQSPLLQDGGTATGTQNRIVTIDIASGKVTGEYVYPLDLKKDGTAVGAVSEIVALNDHEFLVDERDGKNGDTSKQKFFYHIDIKGATNVLGNEKLSDVVGLVPVTKDKTPFLSMIDPKFGLNNADLYSKIESIAFGYDVTDSNGELWHTIVIANDNDFTDAATAAALGLPAAVPNTIYVFGVSADDALFNSFEFDPQHLPEPGALALFGLGLAGLIAGRRRK